MRTAVKNQFTRIDAKVLIPGRGQPVEDGSLVFSDGSIVFVGAQGDLPNRFAHLEALKVPVLMPGMWDCHVHFMGSNRYGITPMATTQPTVAGIRSARDAVATLNAGFTTVREMAGYGVEMSQVIREGWIPGPHIYSAVSILSQTAGHGDVRTMRLEELWDKIEHGLPCYLCDGTDECTKAVRVQLRRGASVINVAASGGVASEGDDIFIRQFNDQELQAIVDEATRNNLVVAAHCHAKSAVKAALRAGVRTIEHGTFLDEELVNLMVEKDAILIATRSTLEYAIRDRGNWTDEQYAQLQVIKQNHEKSYRLAVKAGVRCAIGTDLGVSALKVPWNHGMNGAEFKYAVEAGMTPLQAIEAGTATAPETLGPKAPRTGQLREGYDADVIALAANPLEDIEILGHPEQVLHVWKSGKMYKKDGHPINVLDGAL